MSDMNEVIFSYTRAQALEDGVLIDVTETAKEAGIRFPVAMTAAAWSDCVAWPAPGRGAGQSESGRLWDVVWLTRVAVQGAQGDRVNFTLRRVPKEGGAARPVALQAVIGPGDAWEPVITVMLRGED